jgi:hypothetical protein
MSAHTSQLLPVEQGDNGSRSALRELSLKFTMERVTAGVASERSHGPYPPSSQYENHNGHITNRPYSCAHSWKTLHDKEPHTFSQ